MQPAHSPAAQRILDAAYAIGVADGIDAIGARSIARVAEVSPSLVSYHFKGIDALLLALHNYMLQRHYGDLEAMAHNMAILPDHLLSPAGFIAAAAEHLAHKERPRTVLLFDLHIRGALLGVWTDGSFAEAAMREFGQVFDLPEDTLWSWAMMLHAGMWYALLDEDPVISQTWMTPIFTRFAARYAGPQEGGFARDPGAVSHTGPTPRRPGLSDSRPSPDRSPRAMRVIEAAISLIARGEKTTARTIAREANLPLASTTYLFENKNEILNEAYRQIYRWVAEDETVGFGDQVVNPITADGRLRRDLALFANMMLHLAREMDDLELARSIRDTSGNTGLFILGRNGIDGDRLDGLLMAFFMGPYSPAIFSVPPAERQGHIDSNLAATFARLFGTSRLS